MISCEVTVLTTEPPCGPIAIIMNKILELCLALAYTRCELLSLIKGKPLDLDVNLMKCSEQWMKFKL